MDAPPTFFSSDAFFAAVAAVCFPGHSWAPERIRVDGRVFRVLTVEGRPVDRIRHWPFYYETQVSRPVSGSERRVSFLRNTVQRVVPANAHQPGSGERIAPFIDWTVFPAWDSYIGHGDGRGSRSRFSTSARKERKLVREKGRLSYCFDDHDPALVPLAHRWNAAQYATGGDGRDSPGYRLNQRLRSDGLLTATSLRLDERPIAVVLGHVFAGTYHFRLPGFDRSLEKYSPGAILMHRLLRDTYDRGFAQFDLLLGNHSYKWFYATGARVVGPAGAQPLHQRLLRSIPWPSAIARSRLARN